MTQIAQLYQHRRQRLRYGVLADHPARALADHLRRFYLVALALIALADGEVNAAESAALAGFARAIAMSADDAAAAVKQARQATVEDLAEFLTAIEGQPASHLFVIEVLLLGLADGPIVDEEAAALAELMAAFHYAEDRVEWTTKLAIGFASQDGTLVAACLAAPPPDAPPSARLLALAPGIVLPATTYDRMVVKAGEHVVIDTDVVLARSLTVEAGGELLIVGAALTLEGGAAIKCEGGLEFDRLFLGVGPGDASYRMIQAGQGAHVTLMRASLDGGGQMLGALREQRSKRYLG